MLREMRTEGGAFAAALDADSEHEEGKFYVWTAAEVEAVLGKDAKLFKSHYDVHRIGNWEGKSILNRSDKPDLMDAETEAKLAACRAKLWAAREGRVRPGRDHKVLADWNGLAIASLALAAAVLGRPEWLDTAKAAFAFIGSTMASPDGRSPIPGGRAHPSGHARRLRGHVPCGPGAPPGHRRRGVPCARGAMGRGVGCALPGQRAGRLFLHRQ
jgi:uncharacterized protein YyaL (SSP411 family)